MGCFIMSIDSKLIAIFGQSGCGKSTLVREFVARSSDYATPISYTTRSPRQDDRPGQYSYVSRTWIESNHSDFLLASLYGQYYATSLSDITKLLESSRNVILEVSKENALNLAQRFVGRTKLIHLQCSEQVRIERLCRRGMSAEVIRQRQQSEYEADLDTEMSFDGHSYHFIDASGSLTTVIAMVEERIAL